MNIPRIEAPSMVEKRHFASSVLDKYGNMWVIGGVDNAHGTEIFDFGRQFHENLMIFLVC